MGSFFTRRIFQLLLQAFMAATVIFFLIRLVPGDPVRAILGENATEEQVQVVHAASLRLIRAGV